MKKKSTWKVSSKRAEAGGNLAINPRERSFGAINRKS
jgi:hypothetical protein